MRGVLCNEKQGGVSAALALVFMALSLLAFASTLRGFSCCALLHFMHFLNFNSNFVFPNFYLYCRDVNFSRDFRENCETECFPPSEGLQ